MNRLFRGLGKTVKFLYLGTPKAVPPAPEQVADTGSFVRWL
nr:hypothetical protein [uncultured Rhodopila sp.]